MSGISFEQHGSFTNTEHWLRQLTTRSILDVLEPYAEMGVEALRQATPVRSGETANSWFYEITDNGSEIVISWNNSHVNNGVNIAVILQYGHGTGWGGYVAGRDYINPAMAPIFDRIAEEGWKEIIK